MFNDLMFNNIIIYPHLPYRKNDGGINVQYYLGKIIKSYGINVKMVSIHGIVNNNIFNDYCSLQDAKILDIDKTLVIYCEGIKGNPLDAKYVVRWMLSELGKNVPYNYVDSWGKNELVYYFNSELKFNLFPEKKKIIYKNLSCMYIDDKIQNFNNERNGKWCHMFRKAVCGNGYHNNLFKTKNHKNIIHPSNSDLYERCDFDSYINIFNSYKYFISYDPLTFYSFIAALCGCISIVYPVEGMTKLEWLQKSPILLYLEYNKLDNVYGIAYGIEDIPYAEQTLHLVKAQWEDITKFNIEHTVEPFLKDMIDFDSNLNTIHENYYE